jgi:hypothetical protein
MKNIKTSKFEHKVSFCNMLSLKKQKGLNEAYEITMLSMPPPLIIC